MPASLTRSCPVCGLEKRTGLDFREPGEKTGRPPKICRACRVDFPTLAATYAKTRLRRPSARALQRSYADRSPEEISAATRLLHPDGLKACPEVGGCGQTLPLARFSPDRFQADGLTSFCSPCSLDYHR